MTTFDYVPLPDLADFESRLPTESNEVSIPLFVVGSLDDALAFVPEHSDALTNWAKVHGFEGKASQTLLLPDGSGAITAVFVGAKQGDEGLPKPGFAFGSLPGTLPAGTYKLENEIDDLETALTAFLLGGHIFTHFKPAKRGTVVLVCDDKARDRAIIQARGVAFARNLINTPANLLGPEALAASANGLAEAYEAEFKVTIGDELLDPENPFPLVHTVGAAAKDAPRLIDMSWVGAEEGPRVTLVGKGVLFRQWWPQYQAGQFHELDEEGHGWVSRRVRPCYDDHGSSTSRSFTGAGTSR